MSNMTEFARLGEMRRSIEQTTLFDEPGGHYATGFIRGLPRPSPARASGFTRS